MANTKAVTDKIERKKVKRVMRKKAEAAKPKPKRTHARGEGQTQNEEDGSRPEQKAVERFRAESPYGDIHLPL